LDVLLHFALDLAAEAELVLLVGQILDIDDDFAPPRHGGGMLARLDLGHDDLVRQIHERMVLDGIEHPPAIEDIDAVEHLPYELDGVDRPASVPGTRREFRMPANPVQDDAAPQD